MAYTIYFPQTGRKHEAAVVGLEVHFSGGVESIRMRSTQTAVAAIKRAYPQAAIYERGRFGFMPADRRIA